MSESGGTFFGLIVKPHKRYDTTVQESFRLSKACIEPSSVGDKVTSLYAEYESEEFILANFDKKTLSESLDLGFSTGEKVSFKVEGPGIVHLTGNIMDEDFEPGMMMNEDSDEEEDTDLSVASPDISKAAKRKKTEDNAASPVKKIKMDTAAVNGKADSDSSEDEDEEDSDEDSSDDDEAEETTLGDLDSTNNFAEEEDSDDDSDDDEEGEDDSDSDEETESPVQKPMVNGKAKKTPTKDIASKVDEASKKAVKTPKQEAKTPKQEAKTPKQEGKTPKQEGKTPKQDGKADKKDAKTPKQNGKIANQEAKTPKTDAKTPKLEGKTPKQEAKAAKQDVKTPKQDVKTPKSDVKTPKQDLKNLQTPKSAKKTLKGGIQIEELKEGTGPEAKPGHSVGMYYAGRLKSNNKQFDACLSGKPFRFKLGKGEVIKGWEVGVSGMKVGGKRRLTVPPSMGYGAGGAPPDIPGNSTLVFDVECKYTN